ncbi:hypothetical protein CBR_g32434 [Chara braunii]|uniref:Ribulose-phosphate 3-epimerase n=1 Tax=Chara braunii TaxID=69332 RepID=A0A388JYF6_CHABU|nr:hypothetical protein CBR_g32434 [Chara braunii]|eukprot:GBG62851.1 hypothetical protein CBR_g32434 [Chara braunii]
MAEAGASQFTFHLEVARGKWQQLVKKIKDVGMRVGVAIKPRTPVDEVFPLVESDIHVDMVLVMTVEPGFGGQKFMPETMSKVKVLRQRYPWLDIEIFLDRTDCHHNT